jgi:TatD DNase family protein
MNPMTLSDAHCHLQDAAFADDLSAQLAQAELFGIRRFVVNGTHPSDWEAVVKLAKQRSEIIPQFGVHPWKVENLPGDWEGQLQTQLLRFPTAGIGEAGLDGQLTDAPMDLQIAVLETQLDIARRFNRPCTLHVVKAWPEIEKILKTHSDLRFLLHSFSGSAEQVAEFLKYDCYFSFGGAVLRQPPSMKTLAALRAVPADRLLLETDAPFQHPDGKQYRQEPPGLLRIAEAAAKIRGERLDQLSPILEANIHKFFGFD